MAVRAVKDKQLTSGAELVEIGLRGAALQYQLIRLSADFDDSDEWVYARSRSAAHWIAQRLDIEVSTAREWIRVGKALRRLPAIDEAFKAKRLSYSKVRTLTRFARPETESELCELSENVPAGDLNTALAAWSMRNEDPEVIAARHRRDRGLYIRTEADGMITGRILLPPLEGGKLKAAVDAEMRQSHASAGAPSSLAQQRADALVAVVSGGGVKVETEIVVHVRGDGASLDDGTPIVGSLVERMAPLSFIRALIHDADSRPINASGRHRHPTLRQKRVVKERDRVCVDCGSTEFLQFDHVPEFEISKHTVVDELELRCAFCHRKRPPTET